MPETAASGEPTLVITRVFDAPRDLVWKVWTEPEHIRQWWGPKGFTAPHASIDLRPGGRLHYSMCSPEGEQNWVAGEVIEVTPPERISWIMVFSNAEGERIDPSIYGVGPDYPRDIHDVITFETLDAEHTRITIRRNTPLSVSERYGQGEGWSQSMEKFAAELVRAAS